MVAYTQGNGASVPPILKTGGRSSQENSLIKPSAGGGGLKRSASVDSWKGTFGVLNGATLSEVTEDNATQIIFTKGEKEFKLNLVESDDEISKVVIEFPNDDGKFFDLITGDNSRDYFGVLKKQVAITLAGKEVNLDDAVEALFKQIADLKSDTAIANRLNNSLVADDLKNAEEIDGSTKLEQLKTAAA